MLCATWAPETLKEVIKVKDEFFENMPLLLPVPTTARILGISRATAYRLASTGEPPTRRLGGRVYVVTASPRELGAA